MKAEEVLKQYATGERNFAAANLNEVNLSGANLSKANLSGANLSVANLSGSNLSEADLSKAKLNVTKLSGANLSKANLTEANLNVANLTLADLSGAELSKASLVRAELARSDFSGANLRRVNFSGADLKDAKLRQANLSHANLSRADLKWATLTTANLTHANLHGADLSSADFSGADLSNTELRQANLSRANLSGANLSGANLRWADLSGTDLSWADLSGAKLSGANLTGANLSHANLFTTSLVHVDLTRANLIGVDWAGADLSGAILTGAKLYDVLRFGIKSDGMICEWIDLSPNGDQSNIYRLTSEDHKGFFREMPPTVRIVIDATLDQDANFALAVTYRQLAESTCVALNPPNIQSGRRRTTLTFEMESDEQLFLTACIAILPFEDSANAQKNVFSLRRLLQSTDVRNRFDAAEQIQQLHIMLDQILLKTSQVKLSESFLKALAGVKFFKVPTKTVVINSSGQTLNLYTHPMFGKRLINTEASLPTDSTAASIHTSLPELETFIDFVEGFHFTGST